MTESDDTDVLLLIPNDFFAVDESSSAEQLRRTSNSVNLISFGGSAGAAPAMDPAPQFDFGEYCQNNFENTLDASPPQKVTSQERLLREIDGYLHAHPDQHHQQQRIDIQEPASFLDGKYDIEFAPELSCFEQGDTVQLPSLTEIWSRDRRGIGNTPHMMEEKLRRQHLERTLHSMQRELFEAQQKIVVALKVDRAKDQAIGHLKRELHQHGTNTAAMALENDELRRKCVGLEQELAHSLEKAKTCREQNENLEQKVAHLTTATNDIREINKKQIDDLQVRLSNSLKAEQLINDDLVRSRNQCVLEKRSHQDSKDMWQRKEANFKGELDTLRASLKQYYQQQLNEVVTRKVAEFQRQMDDLESNLKMDFLRRERQIAERAVQQMELIFKKNDQEIELLGERHREEVEFYRLQLDEARIVIDEARERLSSYQAHQQPMGGERGTTTVGLNKDFDGLFSKRKSQFSTPKRGGETKKENAEDESSDYHSPELQNYIQMVSSSTVWICYSVCI